MQELETKEISEREKKCKDKEDLKMQGKTYMEKCSCQ